MDDNRRCGSRLEEDSQRRATLVVDLNYAVGRSFGRRRKLAELERSKGQELIRGVMELVDRLKPLHLSIVGGDPPVRYRELEAMCPNR
jgi:hypothetical protein